MEVEAKAGVPETPEQFIIRRDAEIKSWLDKVGVLATLKPEEMEARSKVTATLFPSPKKGTQRYQLNGGYAIKLVHGTTYTLGDKNKVIETPEGQVAVTVDAQVREMLTKLYGHLIESGKDAAEANTICNSLVKWKPELSETAYLALDTSNNVQATTKAIIDEILTTKPASPQLTFELPKEPK